MVEAVSRELKKQGIRVWLDKDQILPSDSIGLSIGSGLADSSHFVLFWSKDCVGAKWIERELGPAVQTYVHERKPLIVVSLDDTKVPAIISDLLRISGADLSPEDIANRLADAIKSLRKRAAGS